MQKATLGGGERERGRRETLEWRTDDGMEEMESVRRDDVKEPF